MKKGLRFHTITLGIKWLNVYNIQHTYTYFHMIKDTAKLVAFYNHAKKVVVTKVNTANCIIIAVLPLYALFAWLLLGDFWFPFGAASEAGGGGEIGGTSHEPNVAFAWTYILVHS